MANFQINEKYLFQIKVLLHSFKLGFKYSLSSLTKTLSRFDNLLSCFQGDVIICVSIKNTIFPLKFIHHAPIIYSTYPPRLSGFNREAQPWRVFYAYLNRSGNRV